MVVLLVLGIGSLYQIINNRFNIELGQFFPPTFIHAPFRYFQTFFTLYSASAAWSNKVNQAHAHTHTNIQSCSVNCTLFTIMAIHCCVRLIARTCKALT